MTEITADSGAVPYSESSNEESTKTFKGDEATAYTTASLPPSSRSIRLLSFERSRDGDITGTLTVHSLDDAAIDWVALSYTWQTHEQDPHRDRRHTITVNDNPLSIQENLWRALNCILEQRSRSLSGQETQAITRHNHEPAIDDSDWQFPVGKWRYFWIDAICIDQDQIAERSHQVGLMKDIFSRAVTVIAWLTPRPMQEIYTPEKIKHTLLNHYGPRRISKRTTPCDWDRLWSGIQGAWVYTALLVDNIYWERMWIIQELLLASQIRFLYEGLWMDISVFDILHFENRSGLSQYQKLVRDRTVFRSLQQDCGILDSFVKSRSLIVWVRRYGTCRCSDPRDRIYALLGLLPVKYHVQPDYLISPTDLLLDVAHFESAILLSSSANICIDPASPDKDDSMFTWPDSWSNHRMTGLRKRRANGKITYIEEHPEDTGVRSEVRYIVDALEIGPDDLVAQGIVAFYETFPTAEDFDIATKLKQARHYIQDSQADCIEAMLLGLEQGIWIPRTRQDVLGWLLGAPKGRKHLDSLLFKGTRVEEADKISFLKDLSRLCIEAEYSIKSIRLAIEGQIP